jgi:hypothetical protein
MIFRKRNDGSCLSHREYSLLSTFFDVPDFEILPRRWTRVQILFESGGVEIVNNLRLTGLLIRDLSSLVAVGRCSLATLLAPCC